MRYCIKHKKDDLILVSQHWLDDEYSKMFKRIPKYQVTNNYTKYKNGEIVYEPIKNITMKFRHGYTVSLSLA